jgi:hypothetical protein
MSMLFTDIGDTVPFCGGTTPTEVKQSAMVAMMMSVKLRPISSVATWSVDAARTNTLLMG